jgi:hypothetical protein
VKTAAFVNQLRREIFLSVDIAFSSFLTASELSVGLSASKGGKFAEFYPDWRRLDERVEGLSSEIEAIACRDSGFWVAREAEKRIGGLFLFRCSALRFARQKSLPTGCALMFVGHLELDVDEQGIRLVAIASAVMASAKRRALASAAVMSATFGRWRKLTW